MGQGSLDITAAYGDGRVSPPRRIIATAAAASPGAFTIEELALAARAIDESVGTATVYRAVAAMEASGWVERVGERGGSALFARCGEGSRHHHHLVCESCGSIRATDCPVAGTVGASADLGGFVVTRHEVTYYGLCPQCAPEPAREA